jgi:polyferredoxin
MGFRYLYAFASREVAAAISWARENIEGDSIFRYGVPTLIQQNQLGIGIGIFQLGDRPTQAVDLMRFAECGFGAPG